MNPNPFKGLLLSRKFWIALLDAAAGLVGLWVGILVQDAQVQGAILTTFGLLQPVFLAVIGGIAYEDGKAKERPQ